MDFLKVILTTWLCILESIVQFENTTACRDGYYGYNCSYKCGENCLNSKCTDSMYGTFTCTDGCSDGHSGRSCRTKCYPHCTKCQRSDPANCTHCKRFYHGYSCQDNCKSSCPDTDCDDEGKCLQKTVTDICGANCRDCNMRSEICELCESGFYGEKCNLICSKNCNCAPNDNARCVGKCDKNTGHCSQGCVRSYFGKMCQFRCSDHCANDVCDTSTGSCINGCKDGYFGETCEYGCSEYCKNCVCDNVTGLCLQGCEPGYYGVSCTQECSKHCLYGICEPENGDCSNGCTDGYFGLMCEHECVTGCAVCHRNTGECIVTFTPGDGATHNHSFAVNTTNGPLQETTTTEYLYFIIGGMGVIIFVLITISIICLRRCRTRKGKEKRTGDNKQNPAIKDGKTLYTEVDIYSEICEDDVNLNSISPRRAKCSSVSLPFAADMLPAAHPYHKFRRSSATGHGGQITGSTTGRYVKETRDLNTDELVSELHALSELHGCMKVCDTVGCSNSMSEEGEIQNYISAVEK